MATDKKINDLKFFIECNDVLFEYPNSKKYIQNPKFYNDNAIISSSKTFIEKFKRLTDNISVITEIKGDYYNQKEHRIKLEYPEIKSIIKLHQRDLLNYNNGIFIGKNPTDLVNIVKKNPYTYCFLFDTPYNQNLETGKRIIRIKDLNDIFKYLPEIQKDMESRKKRKDLQDEYFSTINTAKCPVNLQHLLINEKSLNFKDTSDLMKKYNINEEKLLQMISNLTIYSDYDDIFVEFVRYAINYLNKELGTKYKYSDVTDFYFFQKPELTECFNKFLNIHNLYDNIQPVKNAQEVMDILSKISKQFYVLTSTVGDSHLSKEKQIDTLFNFISKDKVIKTSNKGELNYNNAVLIDDGFHNARAVVENNPFGFVLLRNTPYNKEFTADKRIIRFNKLEEIYHILPYIALKIHERHLREDLKIEEINVKENSKIEKENSKIENVVKNKKKR